MRLTWRGLPRGLSAGNASRILRRTLAVSRGETCVIESAALQSTHTLGRAHATRILGSIVARTHLVNKYLACCTVGQQMFVRTKYS